MAQGLINDSTLNAIATAINTKSGESGTMSPSQMATKIGALVTVDDLDDFEDETFPQS